MRTAFPDFKAAPETMVADDDTIAFAYVITGTHTGPFMGIPRPGKRSEFAVSRSSKFRDGKMVERWGSSDELGMLQQLGLMEAPKAA